MSRESGEPKKADEHQRSGGGEMSSQRADVNRENIEKPELKAQQQDEPVEQHRSSRRPRQRQHK